MYTLTGLESTGAFWSDNYRGHVIAALKRGTGWLVYQDHHVLQHNKLFASAEAAAAWLKHQIDAISPSDRGLETGLALGERAG